MRSALPRSPIIVLAIVWQLTAARGVSAQTTGIFGVVNATVSDPQQRPIPRAGVTLHAQFSDWQAHAETTAAGTASFTAVPAGEYTIDATSPGFETVTQRIAVRSGSVTSLALALPVGSVAETVHVTGSEGVVNLKSTTTESLVTRDEIQRTPGALRSNSLDAVTQFVPGAYLVHDQLHIRGGHQISWLVDGVPVPNTNIASNVGPQFDPKDIDTIEIERGGYSAEFGDRTYGVFNVVPRSGFERNREAEALLNYGTYHETNSQFSLGDHTERTAYYTSVNLTHTDVGLETPVPETIHDEGTGLGAFGSLMKNVGAADQLRLVGSVRSDHYNIPNSPEGQEAGVDNEQQERDALLNLSWLHPIGSGAFLRVSPFYHYNRAAFDGGGSDPITTTDHRSSHYVGAQVVAAMTRGRHNGRIGAYGFYQQDEALFGLQSAADNLALSQQVNPSGSVAVAFAEDQFAATDRISLDAGVRLTHFSGGLTESAVSPRVGGVVRLPGCECAVRAFYGRYYQPPPLTTVSGPLLGVAIEQGFGFLPLKGERDEQYEVGLAIPLRGWAVDMDVFRTNARNFFDHDVIGDSNIFVPLTIDQARIRGFETTLRSPRGRRADAHLAYSHQYVEGRGAVTGGVTDFEPPPTNGYYFLDHDQRDTLTAGADMDVVAGIRASASLEYGSGFLEGDGPGHKPPHAVANLQASRAFGSQWTLTVTVLNVGDTRFLLDESNTFGGTHYNSPRQILAGVRYKFRY